MNKACSILLLMVVLLSGCSLFEKDDRIQEEEVVVNQPNIEVLAGKLQVPWSIDRINQAFYISERTGNIVKMENGKIERQPVRLEKPLAKAAEAGLLGFVLDPQFQDNHKAYAYYTYSDDGKGQFNRVIVLRTNGSVWSEEKILLDRIPSAAYHHGGRLKIGPDGMLYITTGDATTPETAQNLKTLNGKILRINLDGTIPEDNPFPNSYVYSYGHRNPQGLVWVGGTLYASEHGPSAHDEINRITPGSNYGWPVIQGPEQQAGMVTPLYQSGDETWAPSGLAAANGKLYAATLRGNAVREFGLRQMITRPVITSLGRIRDLYVDGDYLYFVSNNTDGRGTPDEKDDKLYRVLLRDL
ncbi:Glucose/arabinose dehydrogenase, beta-propeller fold [Bacillus sp. OV166]|uniref:PQQ-dependent sugar dehydrogenase n=1 Tax=Bacillus sp. OV166 TaxID=1882763 RepID=UPI000A2AD6BB|nr:sorbosone dehydrogenase family protein [Bacillus sp. OV166]SMQ58635.1 Glucose/arabinose dehydrogenase, beta-propeller fold [Bacillus sp. OV166]